MNPRFRIRSNGFSSSVLARNFRMKKYIALTILLVIIGLPYWVIKNPRQSWDFAQKHFLPKDLHVTWTDMDFKAKHISGLNFYINWNIDGLSVQKDSPGLDLVLDKTQLEASFFPRSEGQKITVH